MVSVNKKSRKSLENAALMLLEPSEINTKRYPAMASTSLDCVEARIGVGGSAGFSKAGSTIGRSSVRNAACSAEADPRQGADDTVEVVGGLTEAGIDFGRSNSFAQASSIIGRSSACLVEADPCRGDNEAVGRSIEAGIDVGRSAGFAQSGSIIGQSFGNTVEAVGGLFKTCINVGRSCGSAEACTMEGEPRHGATMDDGGGIGEDGDALDGQRFDVEDTTALSLGDGGVDGAGNNLC
mmetsp:Transcript_832/g.1622  ORF Transcript_832/g.1622 Transcript_832/m.1622 type:complete len:238 (+) Transcript_832:201-914(+)